MSSGKVNCTCGWSWNKSDSSAKDMYICHECGRDNSNNMKNGGWLDSYADGGTMQEHQENYNDSKATASPDMVGDGFSNVGRNYSPAWGGQFQEGGEIPNAQKGKKLKPITTNDPTDPRLHKYLDSLNLYKGYELSKKYNIQDENAKLVPKTVSKGKVKYSKASVDPHNSYEDYLIYQKKFSKKFNETYDKQGMEGIKKDPFFNTKKAKTNAFKTKKDLGKYAKEAEQLANEYEKLSFREPTETGYWKTPDLYHPTISDIGSYYKGAYNPIFKKPNQEVIYSGNPSDVAALRQKPYVAGVTNPKVQEQVRLQRPNVKAIQNNLQPEGVIQSDAKLNADVSSLRPKIKQPEYYDITSQRQNMSGLSDYYNYNKQKMNVDDAVRATEAAETYNKYIEEKYGKEALKNPKAQERLKQLKQNVEVVPQAQTGGSIPGSVGFTYARTKGIPSNGPYAKKTLASAQNGIDMYGNPITAELKYDQSVNRTNYNPRTNQMIFGNDMPYFLSQEQRDKTLAHENRHAWQFANDRTNFNIVHQPEYAFQDRLKKKPEQPSTDEVFHSYHDRKQREVAIDVNKFKASYPELSFMPDKLIYKKFVDSQQYDNPLSVEGEAQYYENTGERSFQNGGEMKFYQHGLDFKPKSISRDGGWLNKYDQAQNGKKKFKLKDESLQAIKPSESTFVKKPNFEAEQAKVQRTYVDQVGKQMAEEKRRKKLTKDQREREDYNARNEQTGSIQTPIEESTWDRTKAIASNPLTAFGYAARNQSLPIRFQHGERNTLDNAIDWINPLQGAAALSEIPGELGRGEFLNAGLSALDAADLGVYAKGAKQLRNINPEGKVFNGLNNQLDDISIKNTERYMSKRTPSNTPLSKEMNPQLLDNFDSGEYTPFQEDDYMKWFNEQKAKMIPPVVKQDPRSILRSSSIIDINDMKEGGVIKDDMGQWKYPGQITEIGSNQITMQGVPYDVLGISDTGDTKLMKPGKDYKFKGKKVTEFPMAKNGRRQEQKGLQNLEDLTNFTNYNKPSNWLNKYN
jgi:hypothetical protein